MKQFKYTMNKKLVYSLIFFFVFWFSPKTLFAYDYPLQVYVVNDTTGQIVGVQVPHVFGTWDRTVYEGQYSDESQQLAFYDNACSSCYLDTDLNAISGGELETLLDTIQAPAVDGRYWIKMDNGTDVYWFNFVREGGTWVTNDSFSTFYSIRPSYETLNSKGTTTNVQFEVTYFLGSDAESQVEGQLLYNTICFKPIDLEASTTYAFNYANINCDGGDTSTIGFPLKDYQLGLGYFHEYFDVPLKNGHQGIFISIQSRDGYVLISTSTELVIGTSTYRNYQKYIPNSVIGEFSSYSGCVFDLSDTDNMSLWERTVFGFKVALCELFIPSKTDMASIIRTATSTILNKFPLGYVTSFVSTISSTATSSIPIFSATIPAGMAGAGASITLDISHSLDYILNATTSADFMSGTATSTQTFYELTETYWNIFVYIGVFLYILYRILGSALIPKNI